MKGIFVGSAAEARKQTEKVVEVLKKVPGVEPRPWYEYDVFKPGYLTYEAIEAEARKVAGAVFLAAPDDPCIMRGNNVYVPRANVILELGYFSAILGREGIAICKYDKVELPSDLNAIVHVTMGSYPINNLGRAINVNASAKLTQWASSLRKTTTGCFNTIALHGYSGRWAVNKEFEIWRKRNLSSYPGDFVVFDGYLDLHILQGGNGGYGCLHGTMIIEVGDSSNKDKRYRARVQITDRISNINCRADGSLSLESKGHSRERVTWEGIELESATGIREEFDPAPCRWTLQPDVNGACQLVGHNEMSTNKGLICDRAMVQLTKVG